MSCTSYIAKANHTQESQEERRGEERRGEEKKREEEMGNSLRCCLACVLPCGALDVIRVVHLNGHVEEYSNQISAAKILEANPDHVISKPCSQGVKKKIMIISPDAELKRGNIYFLIPASSLPQKKKKGSEKKHHQSSSSVISTLEEQKPRHRRRRSGQVEVFRRPPQLQSISEES